MSEQQQFRPANMALCVFAISLGVFMQVLDSTIANVSLPTIAGNMGVSLNQGTWVITSFTVSNAIGLPITAWLSRRVGEVRLYVGALILFSLMSLMCGVSQTMSQLVVFRTLQGLAAAPLFPVSQVLLMSIFPKDKRHMALALIGMVAVVGPILGPILGGWLTYDYSWPWIFFINIPIGIFTVLVVLQQMKGRPHTPQIVKLDVIGLATMALGVGVLQVVLDKGNDLDWFSNPWIIGGSIFAVIMLVFMVIWELTDDNPIINLKLFRNRNFCIGTIILTCGYAGFFSINLILPQWLQSNMGYTALWAGLACAPMGVLPLFLTPILGKFGHKMDMRVLAAGSFVVIAMTCYARARFNTDVDFATVAWIQLFMGIGIALFFMPMTTILLSDLHGSDVADAASLSTFIRTIGASFASSLTSWFWAHNAALHHSVMSEHISSYNPLVAQDVQHGGLSYLENINGTITNQSYMMSTIDLFTFLMVMLLILVPFIFFTKKASAAH
ncbi:MULTISPECIES: DHA2 family efflux MFS transporter permease subunit [Vibrio]|uniref:DHA2 family efflux MFS transporter permease subunit n=2 Tax=Vibrio TaxID=662 RepID=A0A7X4RTK5_9VIBR|nr:MULTISPECIES: DHA2 family efflux MFS transporter permease subunit [Vibrio]MBF9002858.1 DHA2 family efflux MFS transporter permease subunit [Vibrio nitrifigilis]MZI92901.1 DHA2 family efflux MFS transporter permease subunit [Vibrio eleionomae]